MSENRWDEIEFDKIPSRAGMIYKNAFARHDIERMKQDPSVQSYADSLFRAAEINRAVEKAMKNLTDLESVSKCKLNSSYNYTDTDSKKYRYQAVFDITFMEGE